MNSLQNENQVTPDNFLNNQWLCLFFIYGNWFLHFCYENGIGAKQIRLNSSTTSEIFHNDDKAYECFSGATAVCALKKIPLKKAKHKKRMFKRSLLWFYGCMRGSRRQKKIKKNLDKECSKKKNLLWNKFVNFLGFYVAVSLAFFSDFSAFHH